MLHILVMFIFDIHETLLFYVITGLDLLMLFLFISCSFFLHLWASIWDYFLLPREYSLVFRSAGHEFIQLCLFENLCFMFNFNFFWWGMVDVEVYVDGFFFQPFKNVISLCTELYFWWEIRHKSYFLLRDVLFSFFAPWVPLLKSAFYLWLSEIWLWWASLSVSLCFSALQSFLYLWNDCTK